MKSVRFHIRVPMLIVLALFAAMAMPLAATAAAAVDEDSCIDNKDFVFNKGKSTKDCDWVGKNNKRRKKLCKKSKAVFNSCPETCGACNNKITTCPKTFKSKIFKKKNNGGADCSKYEPGLECNYNFQYFYGCSSSGGGSDETETTNADADTDEQELLQCYPADTYRCVSSNWQLSSFAPLPCVGPPPPKDLPIGEECNPKDCPLAEPENKSNCSDGQVGIDCPYAFSYQGCSLDNIQCFPSRFVTCTKDKKWQLALQSSASIPEPCEDGTLPIGEPCDPNGCPLVEPKNQSDCSGYKKDNLDCAYNFKYSGCTLDDLQCSPLKYYQCINDEEENKKKKKWQLIVGIPLPCEEDPPKDLPIGDSCDPKECPLGAPTIDSTCSEQQAKAGLDCEYNFRYLGCSFPPSCIATDFYQCSENDQRWLGSSLIPHPCAVPEQGFPTGEECDVCPTTVAESVDGVIVCPAEEPKDGSDCSGYESNLDCKYKFEYSGCTKDELQCTPEKFYTCTNDGTWMEGAYGQPVSCPKGCPKYKPMLSTTTTTNLLGAIDEANCVSIGYESGLVCEYEFVLTGCTEELQQCSPTEFYECTKDDGWIVSTVDQENCSDNNPEQVPDDFGDQCVPGPEN